MICFTKLKNVTKTVPSPECSNLYISKKSSFYIFFFIHYIIHNLFCKSNHVTILVILIIIHRFKPDSKPLASTFLFGSHVRDRCICRKATSFCVRKGGMMLTASGQMRKQTQKSIRLDAFLMVDLQGLEPRTDRL